MTMTWEQLVYGKLVQSAGGPIVPRLDYRVTGASAGYPNDLVAQSHPHYTGVSTNDLFDWQRYPWNASGGFVVRATMSQQGPMVIVGRIRGRSEKGEGQRGRHYAQAHYAVTHAKEWNPAAIALLARLLTANPMTAEDRAMPQLRLGDHAVQEWLGRPLDPGWIDRVADPLAAVMSGSAFSIQDWQAPIEAFLDRCAICVCAVPQALAWRLSIGAGLGEMKGDVAIGLGQIAPKSGVRVVGGSIQGAGDAELASGRRYVAWLRHHASAARTVAELQRTIAELLPDFADPLGLDAQLDWRETAKRIAATVTELVELDELAVWLQGRPGTPPDFAFRQFCGEALRLILRDLAPRGLDILPGYLTTEWSDAWSRLAGDDTEAARLAGSISRLAGLAAVAPQVEDVERLAGYPLPPRVVRLFETTLDKALNAGRLDARWERILDSWTGRVPWLDNWFARSSETWFWGAIDHLQQHGDDRLLKAVRTRGGVAIKAFDTLQSRHKDADYRTAAEGLVRSALNSRRTPYLNRLLDNLIRTGRILAAVVLAETCDQHRLNIATARVLISVDPADNARRAELAQALVGELEESAQQPLGSIALKLLLTPSPQPRMGDQLRRTLAARLGDPFAHILLGTSSPILSTRVSPSPEALARIAFLSDVGLIDRLWSELCKTVSAASDLERLFREWIEDSRVPSSAKTPAVRFLAHLLRGQLCPLPDVAWKEPEVPWIQHFLAARMALVLRCIEAAENLAQLRNGFQIFPRRARIRPESGRLFMELVDKQLNKGGRIESLLGERARELQSEPVWRLLFLPWDELRDDTARQEPARDEGWNSFKPHLEEIELSKRLSSQRRLHLAALGLRLPPDLLPWDIAEEELEAERLSLYALATLARAAYKLRLLPLLYTINRVLLKRVHVSPIASEELATELRRGKFDRIASSFKRRDVSALVETVQMTLGLLSQDERQRLLEEGLYGDRLTLPLDRQ
jgi:hypothetical protein